MHGQVHLAAEQRLAQRADEDAGAADLSQLRPADVAQRGHPDDLDLAAGPLGDHAGHLAGLRDGHRAPAAAQPESHRPKRHRAHREPSCSGAARVTASTARGSRSKSTRSAAAYSSPPGEPASSLTRTVGACNSLSTTRRTVWAISSRAWPLSPSALSRPASLASSASTTLAALARRATTVGATRAASTADWYAASSASRIARTAATSTSLTALACSLS